MPKDMPLRGVECALPLSQARTSPLSIACLAVEHAAQSLAAQGAAKPLL